MVLAFMQSSGKALAWRLYVLEGYYRTATGTTSTAASLTAADVAAYWAATRSLASATILF